MYELLRQALRQRPEYIIVGEIRGAEAQTLFQAMSTGHTTYSTMHATYVEEVVSRLQNEPINIPLMMFQSLDIICIQILTYTTDGKRVRRNKVIAEIQEVDPNANAINVISVFQWDPESDDFNMASRSLVLQRVMKERGWGNEKIEEEIKNRCLVLEYMSRHNIRKYKDVFSLIQGYFNEGISVLERVGEADLSKEKD